jgi:hypothetical protein
MLYQDDEFDGQVIEHLLATVSGIPETDPKFYRPAKFSNASVRVTTVDTPSTIAGWAFEGDDTMCPHCDATFGHTILCPLLNRTIAEARSALFTPTEADHIQAHALGIQL